MLATLRTDIFKREKKKGKKRKEKALEKVGGGGLTRFLGKILPHQLNDDDARTLDTECDISSRKL